MLNTLHEESQFSPQDGFLQQSSTASDLSMVQIFPALCSGGRICIPTLDCRQDPADLANFMLDNDITVTNFTPTQYTLLVQYNATALSQCKTHRISYMASERLPVRVVETFYALRSTATTYNTWSPSEVVVQTTIAKIEPPQKYPDNLPIGSSLSNCRHYIVDRRGNPLPAGFIGEICVGGAQVGKGYTNRRAIMLGPLPRVGLRQRVIYLVAGTKYLTQAIVAVSSLMDDYSFTAVLLVTNRSNTAGSARA